MLIDDTRYQELAAYSKAINQYVEVLRTSGVLRSVYQFGNVDVPGLSDIDLVVVLKRRVLPGKTRLLLVDRVPGINRYLFLHNPLFVNQYLFERLHYIYPLFSLWHVWGEHLYQSGVREVCREDIAIAQFVNMVITKVPINFYEILVGNVDVSARNAIGMLNSFKHTYRFFREVSGETIEVVEKYVQEFEDFRLKWFDLPGDVRMRDLEIHIHRIGEPVSALVGHMSRLLESRYGLVVNGDVTFRKDCYDYHFVRDWDESLLKDDIAHVRVPIRLPLVFAMLLLQGSTQPGPFGRFLRSGISECEWGMGGKQVNECFVEFNSLKYEYARFAASTLLMSGTPFITMGYRPLRQRWLSWFRRFLKR